MELEHDSLIKVHNSRALSVQTRQQRIEKYTVGPELEQYILMDGPASDTGTE